MATITVQFDIAFPTTDGSYLGLYTTSFPVPKTFSVLDGPDGHLFDITLIDSDVKEDGLSSVLQSNGKAVGLLTVYTAVSGGAAVLDGYYAVHDCFVDLNHSGTTDDRLRMWTSPRLRVRQ